MAHQISSRMLGLAVIACAIGASGCHDPEAEPVAPPVRARPAVLTEHEMVADPAIRATLDTSVVLSLERAQDPLQHVDTGVAGVDVIPYELEAPETLRLCFPQNGEADRVVFASDDPSVAALEVAAGEPCVSRNLPAGHYTMTFTRDSASPDAAAKGMFVHAATPAAQCPPSPDVLDRKGNRWMLRSTGTDEIVGTFPEVPDAGPRYRPPGGVLPALPLHAAAIGDYVPARGLEIFRDGANVVRMNGQPYDSASQGLGTLPITSLLLDASGHARGDVATGAAFLRALARDIGDAIVGFAPEGAPGTEYLLGAFDFVPTRNAAWTFWPEVVVEGPWTSPTGSVEPRRFAFPILNSRAGGTISVTAGTYGGNVGQPRGNKTPFLAEKCDGQRTCSYWIGGPIGDPAPYLKKDYVAEWTCSGDQVPRRATVGAEAGGQTVTLSCPSPALRMLTDAVLGGTATIPDAEKLSLTFAMRWAPSADLVGELAAGEVALYTEPNFKGEAFVINEANAFPNLTEIPLSVPTAIGPKLHGNVRSARLGCDTSLEGYIDKDRTGLVTLTNQDVAASTMDAPVNLYVSAAVRRTRQLVIETKTCTDCNLARVNLEGLHLEKIALTRVDMSGASLAGAFFDDGVFESVKFDGAHLNMTKFPRATFKDVGFTNTDLTSTTLDDAKWELTSGGPAASPCAQAPVGTGYSRFAKTRLTLTQVPLAQWGFVDLSDAVLDTGSLAGALAGKQLCGLRLARMSFQGFKLDGTQFDWTDLRGATLAKSTGTHTTFRHADLTGAHLESVNLERPDFTSAKLAKAFLDESTIAGDADGPAGFNDVTADGISLRGATLTKADFGEKASLVGCTASYATLSDVKLPGALFFGPGGNATFLGATFVNVDLSSAHLGNAELNYATFSSQSSLREANAVQARFNGTTFKDVSFVSLVGDSAEFVAATFSNVDFTNAHFRTNPASTLSASFERAFFCGGTLSRTDFDGANLDDALFPKVDVDLPGAPPGSKGCLAILVEPDGTNPRAITTQQTRCPSGLTPAGASCMGDEWKATTPRTVKCCVPLPNSPCPPTKREGKPCTADCDCASESCLASGVCADYP